MTTVPDRSTFENIYAGRAPWDIGRPQKAFMEVADQISGSTLDAGCGTGENALFFASSGSKVTGIDFLEEPIRQAKQKAAERSVPANFLVKDALTLAGWHEWFDNVIDSGLFHVFSDKDRRRYVEGLSTTLKPGGQLFLLCFSDEEPGTQGPRRVSKKELHDAFAQGWKIESIEPSRFEVRPDLKEISFSGAGRRRGSWWCGGWRERLESLTTRAKKSGVVESGFFPHCFRIMRKCRFFASFIAETCPSLSLIDKEGCLS